MGAGLPAGAAGAQALLDNPANLTDVPGTEAILLGGYHGATGQLEQGAAIADALGPRFGFGLAGRGLFSARGGDFGGWEGRLGLGTRWTKAALGGSVRYLNATSTDRFATPQSSPVAGVEQDRTYSVRTLSGDLAASFQVLEPLRVSCMARNLGTSTSVLAPLVVGVSGMYEPLTGTLWVGGDVLLDLNRHRAFAGPRPTTGFGVEYRPGGAFRVRVGHRYDSGRGTHSLSAGASWAHRWFGVDGGFRTRVAEPRDLTALLGLRFLFGSDHEQR